MGILGFPGISRAGHEIWGESRGENPGKAYEKSEAIARKIGGEIKGEMQRKSVKILGGSQEKWRKSWAKIEGNSMKFPPPGTIFDAIC